MDSSEDHRAQSTCHGFPQFIRPIYPSRLTVQREAYAFGDTFVLQCIDRLPFIGYLQQLTVKMIYYDHGLLRMSRYMHYDGLSRVLQSLQHPTLSIRLFLILRPHPATKRISGKTNWIVSGERTRS
ncbi:hypothetical protein BDN71DRAFT_1030473 [Pleurotus eryngii]|uniref:Uncharacterized protein n=1 Tax=Pleurotus eryngii TaxID=5323 RepID=A0A9P6A7E6_PLEER|nr:hypothetical protein BDN71DRAFT_1030473 [Pleurotus eryngii]